MSARISLQDFADRIVDPAFRGPLKTAEDGVTQHGWGDPDQPHCCDERVTVRSMFGQPYYAACKKCGKFMAAADGPTFGNSWVQFVDDEKVNTETNIRWIVGKSDAALEGVAP